MYANKHTLASHRGSDICYCQLTAAAVKVNFSPFLVMNNATASPPEHAAELGEDFMLNFNSRSA